MRHWQWIIGILLLLALSGCSSKEEALPEAVPAAIPLEEKESSEEGLIYSSKAQKPLILPKRLILLMYIDAPQPVSEDLQALVAGILSDKNPLALLEVNGRGKVVGIGDFLGEYRVTAINKKGVELAHE